MKADSPIEQVLIDYLAGTPVAMTLSRGGASDFALIAANPAFTALTRYERDEILGRNCRFLQGEYRAQVVKRQIHAFLSDDGEDNFRGLIVNVRADGKPFINLLYLAKLRDQAGVCRYVLGSQFDASRSHLNDLRAYDGELEKHSSPCGRDCQRTPSWPGARTRPWPEPPPRSRARR